MLGASQAITGVSVTCLKHLKQQIKKLGYELSQNVRGKNLILILQDFATLMSGISTFIIKSPEFIVINGEKVPRPCKSHWTLTPNAVPHKFSNEKVSSYFDQSLKRKSPKKRNSYSSKRIRVAKMELEKTPELHTLV